MVCIGLWILESNTLARLLVKGCVCDSAAIFFPSSTLPSSLLCPTLPDTTGTVTPYTSAQLSDPALKNAGTSSVFV